MSQKTEPGESIGVPVAAVSVTALVLLATGLLLYAASPFNSGMWALAAVTAASLALTWTGMVRTRRLSRQTEKLSSEFDGLAQRLLRLEAASHVAREPVPDPALVGTVNEVTADIGLLGEIVRDIAVTVAAQDRDVAALKERIERGPAPQTAPPERPRPSAPLRPNARNEAPPAPVKPEPTLLPLAQPEPDQDRDRSREIIEAFEKDRLEIHLQPIVSLPQRKVRFYEALARLRLADETLLVPAEFLPVFEHESLMPGLDTKVLARSAAIARHLASRGSEAFIACNLSQASLEEPGFLRAVGRLLDAHPELPGRLVLELSQRSWRTLDAEKAGALALLKDRGLAFALDRASDLRLDPLSLADRGVRFVKLPAEALLAAETLRGLDIEIHDLSAVLSRAGIKLIAERVEREEDVPDLLDLDIPLAQGFVFAPPRAVRAEVLNPSSSKPAEPLTPISPPIAQAVEPDAPHRASFRSFLRRAS